MEECFNPICHHISEGGGGLFVVGEHTHNLIILGVVILGVGQSLIKKKTCWGRRVWVRTLAYGRHSRNYFLC